MQGLFFKIKIFFCFSPCKFCKLIFLIVQLKIIILRIFYFLYCKLRICIVHYLNIFINNVPKQGFVLITMMWLSGWFEGNLATWNSSKSCYFTFVNMRMYFSNRSREQWISKSFVCNYKLVTIITLRFSWNILSNASSYITNVVKVMLQWIIFIRDKAIRSVFMIF